MKAELYMSSKYDGTTWKCRPLEPTEESKARLKMFTKEYGEKSANDLNERLPLTITFYTDNPVVYGFPKETVEINGVKYKSNDLVELTRDDELVIVELLPNGEIELVEDK